MEGDIRSHDGRPLLPGRPSIYQMWRDTLEGKPTMHRVKALIRDLTEEELVVITVEAMSTRGNRSEALRWILLHAMLERSEVPYVPRNPSDYQV